MYLDTVTGYLGDLYFTGFADNYQSNSKGCMYDFSRACCVE
jgi:hypothetical protein